jgi:hypothetical protein
MLGSPTAEPIERGVVGTEHTTKISSQVTKYTFDAA